MIIETKMVQQFLIVFLQVAIAGGSSQGMEVWNPADNSVRNVTAQLPIEEGDSTGLDYAQLLPIKNGTELLLYGGNLVIMMQLLTPPLCVMGVQINS